MSAPLLIKHKSAQIKMIESVSVVIVFFFLVAFGLKFYGNYQVIALEESKQKFLSLNSLKATQLIGNSPLLRCIEKNVDKGACIDFQKLLAVKALSTDPKTQQYFQRLVGFGNVSVEILSSGTSPSVTYLLYESKPEKTTSLYRSRIPIIVYDPVTRINKFALLHVEVTGAGK